MSLPRELLRVPTELQTLPQRILTFANWFCSLSPQKQLQLLKDEQFTKDYLEIVAYFDKATEALAKACWLLEEVVTKHQEVTTK